MRCGPRRGSRKVGGVVLTVEVGVDVEFQARAAAAPPQPQKHCTQRNHRGAIPLAPMRCRRRREGGGAPTLWEASRRAFRLRRDSAFCLLCFSSFAWLRVLDIMRLRRTVPRLFCTGNPPAAGAAPPGASGFGLGGMLPSRAAFRAQVPTPQATAAQSHRGRCRRGKEARKRT